MFYCFILLGLIITFMVYMEFTKKFLLKSTAKSFSLIEEDLRSISKCYYGENIDWEKFVTESSSRNFQYVIELMTRIFWSEKTKERATRSCRVHSDPKSLKFIRYESFINALPEECLQQIATLRKEYHSISYSESPKSDDLHKLVFILNQILTAYSEITIDSEFHDLIQKYGKSS